MHIMELINFAKFYEWWLLIIYVGFANKHPNLLVNEISNDGSDITHLYCKDLGASK